MQACGVADYKVETNTNALASVYNKPIPNGCTVAACGRYPNEVTASFMTSPASLSMAVLAMAVLAMTEWSCELMRMHQPLHGDFFLELVLLENISEESERPVLTKLFSDAVDAVLVCKQEHFCL